MSSKEEYIAHCIKNGITSFPEIVSLLEKDIFSEERSISQDFESLKRRRINLDKLKDLHRQLSPNKKSKDSGNQTPEIPAEIKSLCHKICVFISSSTGEIYPRLLSEKTSLSLQEVYLALKNLALLQILTRDCFDMSWVKGSRWNEYQQLLAES